ncbi:hypothetical protein SAMN05444158_1531 [Bradyrhizobium canariense]|uniref:Uncharacterized protein n=1 Tax=Bradyrhizobium canariense TaxID=255045 RepID=A0A1H1QTR9_9BRAD|nr:hypothetical protein SAMN05444158_1531 [Bradyrhizobium canariense]
MIRFSEHDTPRLPVIASDSAALIRGALGSLRPLLVSFWFRWIRKYRPEKHYMRGPGPKWRQKHVLNRLSANGVQNNAPISAG